LAMPSVHAVPGDDFGVNMSEAPTGLDVAITGHALDISGVLRRKPAAGGKAPGKESIQPFRISVKLDKLALEDGVAISSFKLDAGGTGRHPARLSATGSLGKSSSIAISVTAGSDQRHLTAMAGDAGMLIRGLFGYAIVKGGELSLLATMPSVAAAGNQSNSQYSGDLRILDCTILNQPFLARLFSSGSFGGFLDLLRGEGIALDAVNIPFQISGDVITIHDARASGPSIGVTAAGYVDRATDRIALQGALAPLYGINGLLGAIPVLGDVFVSKKGEGIFGVTYSVSGDISDPTVSTNPLSVLAPGILRRLFEGSAPKAPPPSAPSPAVRPHQ
ncbi:MAG: AsmA-like C-terminal domain-containing protein, partial [Rhizomicrobium sp.]